MGTARGLTPGGRIGVNAYPSGPRFGGRGTERGAEVHGAMKYRGTVKRISTESGLGLIIREDGAKVHLHFAHMVGATFKTLRAGDTVEFECEEGRRGPEARQVTKVEA